MQFDPNPDHKATPKPISEMLIKFQEEIQVKLASLPLNDPRFDLILNNYAALQQAAAVERINEALDLVGDGPQRDKLIKCLLDALRIRERAAARVSREQAAKDKEARRLASEKDFASDAPSSTAKARKKAAKPTDFPATCLPIDPPLIPAAAPSLAARLVMAAGASSPLIPCTIPHYNY